MNKLISIVVPCYNEEAVICSTHERIVSALSKGESIYKFEIIFVNDGSQDGTAELLTQIQKKDKSVRVLEFSRNFGHQNAVTAGMDYATGDAVVLIDADLQDPPEVILSFIEKWEDGCDVVYGIRASRDGESAFKLLTAKLFYRFLNLMSEVPIPMDTGDFRLMDRRVVEVIKNMPEHDRFIRGMVTWVGFSQCEVKYHRHAREAGESKYPLMKMVKFALDGIISFSSAPLKLAINVGFMVMGLSFIGIFYVLFMRLFTDEWVSGWTMMMTVILFLGGVQLFTLGILGEYVGRIYKEGKKRPLYIIKNTTNVTKN